MSIEQHFAAAINADPDDRTLQLVYADWLDEQGDPRAEGWRVLIEAGKRPEKDFKLTDNHTPWLPPGYFGETHIYSGWHWFFGDERDLWPRVLPHASFDRKFYSKISYYKRDSFHDAMDAAAIAWVRCHRDAEFEPDELTERV